jgi:hypothetical protein
MGLAASQSRFLALTARKASCEFQSMQVAQQKLSITRDMQSATEQYYRSMDATKLVWNMDGANSGGIKSDLSYNLLMKASAMNDYTPVFITDRTGKIVLDEKLRKAAIVAGINTNGGTSANSEDRNLFILSLADQGVIPKDIAMKIVFQQGIGTYTTAANGAITINPGARLNTDNYDKEIGAGKAPLDKTASFTMNINNLILYTKGVLKDSKNHGTLEASQIANVDSLAAKLQFDFKGSDGTPVNFTTSGNPEKSSFFQINGQRDSKMQFDFADLFSKDVVLAKTDADNDKAGFFSTALGVVLTLSAPVQLVSYIATGESIYANLTKDKTEAFNDMTDSDRAAIKFVCDFADTIAAMFIKDTQSQDTQALSYALQETLKLLSQTTDLGNDSGYSSGPYDKATKGASQYNGWVHSGATKDGHCGTTAISLSNLAKSFMSFYSQAMGGFDAPYIVDKEAGKTKYVTSDYDYLFMIENVYTKDLYQDQESMMYADYYNMMYNNLCLSGFTFDTGHNLHDKEELAHALKNGQLFLSSLNKDNYYYQGEYTRNGFVEEIKDVDAITRAETEYTLSKNKMNFKEEQLNLKLKNIDMEISAITTEYDAVKGMVSKNVEKSFQMFQ